MAESQLDLYLEGLNGSVDEIENCPEKTIVSSSSKCIQLFIYASSILFKFLHILTVEICIGLIDDILYVVIIYSNISNELELLISASQINFQLYSSRVNISQNAISMLRRCILVYLLIWSFTTYNAKKIGDNNNANNILLYILLIRGEKTIKSLVFSLCISLLLTPILLGIILSKWIIHVLAITRRTIISTDNVMQWIKKIQLTSLGRHLTHPIPPISKIEESVRDVYGDSILSCPESRKALYRSLVDLYEDLEDALSEFNGYVHSSSADMTYGNNSSNNSSNNISSSGNSSNGNSYSSNANNDKSRSSDYIRYEYQAAALKKYQIISNSPIQSTSQLQILSTEIFKKCIPYCYLCIYQHLFKYSESIMYSEFSSKSMIEKGFNFEFFFDLVKFPTFLTRLISAFDRMQARINVICKEMTNYSSSNISSSDSNNNSSSSSNSSNSNIDNNDNNDTNNNNVHVSIPQYYTNIRKELLKVRLNADDIHNRLYLCEKELAFIGSITLLLNQSSYLLPLPTQAMSMPPSLSSSSSPSLPLPPMLSSLSPSTAVKTISPNLLYNKQTIYRLNRALARLRGSMILQKDNDILGKIERMAGALEEKMEEEVDSKIGGELEINIIDQAEIGKDNDDKRDGEGIKGRDKEEDRDVTWDLCDRVGEVDSMIRKLIILIKNSEIKQDIYVNRDIDLKNSEYYNTNTSNKNGKNEIDKDVLHDREYNNKFNSSNQSMLFESYNNTNKDIKIKTNKDKSDKNNDIIDSNNELIHMKIVDVYTATIPLLLPGSPSHKPVYDKVTKRFIRKNTNNNDYINNDDSNDNDSSNNNSSNNSSNDNNSNSRNKGNSIRLLEELQRHMMCLEEEKGTVERMQTNNDENELNENIVGDNNTNSTNDNDTNIGNNNSNVNNYDNRNNGNNDNDYNHYSRDKSCMRNNKEGSNTANDDFNDNTNNCNTNHNYNNTNNNNKGNYNGNNNSNDNDNNSDTNYGRNDNKNNNNFPFDSDLNSELSKVLSNRRGKNNVIFDNDSGSDENDL